MSAGPVVGHLTRPKNGERRAQRPAASRPVKPADLKFLNRQLITVGFVPEHVTLPKPPASTITGAAAGPGRWPGTWRPRPRRPAARRRARCRRQSTTTSGSVSSTTTRRQRPRRTFVHDDDQVMKAVVLVGGEGTRLRPLTLSTPKQMLPIVGVPMIERVLGHLASHGIDEAVLSLGYLPDAFTGGLSRRPGRRHGADLRRRARAARHGRRRPLRRHFRRNRRDLRRRQR